MSASTSIAVEMIWLFTPLPPTAAAMLSLFAPLPPTAAEVLSLLPVSPNRRPMSPKRATAALLKGIGNAPSAVVAPLLFPGSPPYPCSSDVLVAVSKVCGTASAFSLSARSVSTCKGVCVGPPSPNGKRKATPGASEGAGSSSSGGSGNGEAAASFVGSSRCPSRAASGPRPPAAARSCSCCSGPTGGIGAARACASALVSAPLALATEGDAVSPTEGVADAPPLAPTLLSHQLLLWHTGALSPTA